MDDKKTIYVVDDDEGVIELLKEYFESKIYRVVGFKNAMGLLKALRDEKPSLIILDVMMPGIDGYDICHELKNDDITKDIPVLLSTGIDLQAIKNNYKIIRADDYITKPFAMHVLENKINNLINQNQSV